MDVRNLFKLSLPNKWGLGIPVVLMFFSAGNMAMGQSLPDFYRLAGESMDAKQGQYAYDLGVLEAERLTSSLNPSLVVTPATKITDTQTTLNLGFSGTITLGLNSDARIRLENAQTALMLAGFSRDSAFEEGLWKLIRSYYSAVLTIREARVTREEYTIAQSRLIEDQNRFERGEISLVEFTRSEQDYRTKFLQDIDSQLKEGFALQDLEMQFPHQGLSEAAKLTLLPEVPGVQGEEALFSLALRNNADIIKQQMIVDSIRQDTNQGESSNITLSLRTTVDYQGHNTSLGYTVHSKALNLSYSMPGLILGTGLPSGTPTGSNTPAWSITASASLGYNPNPTIQNQNETSLLILQREIDRYHSLEQSLRTTLQQNLREILRAEAGIESAEEAQKRAELLLRSIETRMTIGLVRDLDVQEANITLERANFNLLKAEITYALAVFTYYHNAGQLSSVMFQGGTE